MEYPHKFGLIYCLQYAKKVMADPKWVKKFCKINGEALAYADDDLLDDRDVVMTAAVEQNGAALEYAGAELREDLELVMKAVENNELLSIMFLHIFRTMPTLSLLHCINFTTHQTIATLVWI